MIRSRLLPRPAPHAQVRLALLLTLFLPIAVPAQQATGPIAHEAFTLPNGLAVVLAPDHASQVVAVDVWYLVGSRDESPARAGLARLFERLMFGGTANLRPGGLAALLDEAGGAGDAGVDEDISRFSQTLPSNRLNLGLWLEAERMGSLQLSDTGVAEAKRAAMEELQQRVGGQGYTGAVVQAITALYDSASCPGYTHPPTGRLSTLDSITTEQVKTFHRERFGPGNARLVIAGDFDPVTARALVEQYFGPIPGGATPPATMCTARYSPGPRELPLTDPLAPRPAVGLFYRIPPHDHADAPALELLSIIVGRGQDSWLSRMVAATGSAVGTQGGALGQRRGPGAFGLFAVAADGVSRDSLTALLANLSERLGGAGLTEADLVRARGIYRATAVSGRERPQDVAEALHHADLFHGDLSAVDHEVDHTLATTLEDLRRAARTWLVPANALTLTVLPQEPAR